MSARTLTRPQVAAFVEMVRDHINRPGSKRSELPRLVGVKAAPIWQGDPAFEIEGRTIRVIPCPSPLEFCRALSARPDDESTTLLFFDGSGLPGDALAELFHGKLIDPSLWQMARSLFRAERIDPRLAARRWIAEALIEACPAGGYPPTPTGVLTETMAWGQLLRHHLGLGSEEPTLQDLLRWASRPASARAFAELPEKRRTEYVDWIVGRSGPAARPVLELVGRELGESVIPAGLAARVAYDEAVEAEFPRARANFEAKVAKTDDEIATDVALAWAAAAEALVREGLGGEDAKSARAWTKAGDKVLDGVGAAEHAWRSDVLEAGLHQRESRFADVLTGVIEGSVSPDLLPPALESLESHTQHAREGLGKALTFAVRLARWTRVTSSTKPATLGEAVARHRQDESFVDWCRRHVAEHLGNPRLRGALTALLELVDDRREEANGAFAELAASNGVGTWSDEAVIPIERVLDGLVAPLARTSPVLLVVLDGMSVDVCHELLESIASQGWVECRPDAASGAARWSALTTFPTVTECSRASLLSGELVRGSQAQERKAFTSHSGLRAVSPKAGPTIFHKGDLDGSGEHGHPVEAVADPKRRVVAVVLNTIDDLLASGDQLRSTWTLDVIHELDNLLHAARQAGRTVILTSDHGHVLDRCTSKLRGVEAEAERWRESSEEPRTSELRLAGPRVLLGGESGVIAPWSERVRYVPKKGRGYHGGVTPQECVVPIVVLRAVEQVTGADAELELPTFRPGWWDAGVLQRVAEVAQMKPRRKKAKAPRKQQPTFFETTFVASLLLESERYRQRSKRVGGRRPPRDDQVRATITALEQNGLTLTLRALATTSGLSEQRLSGLLSVLQRILNVDGYDVLSWDRQADAIALNEDELRRHFEGKD